MISIASLNVGSVKRIVDAAGTAYRSGIRRPARTEPQFLAERGFLGDASRFKGHHTVNSAVHVFPLAHYVHYEALAGKTLPVPAFGENFTVDGGAETEVCIGDVFEVGDALVELSQPTERCPTPGRSLDIQELKQWIEACAFTGYYLRVLRPGWVRVNDRMVLQERTLPDWSVDRVTRALLHEIGDEALYEEILALGTLSDDWKARMRVLRGRWLARSERKYASS